VAVTATMATRRAGVYLLIVINQSAAMMAAPLARPDPAQDLWRPRGRMEHTAATRHHGPYTRQCAEGGGDHRVPDGAGVS